jgi:hypothetical protein
MRVEVLYMPGCPNYLPTVEQVREVLASESLSEPIHEMPVNTGAEAQALQFPGSPTVRVNGIDVDRNHTATPGLICRLYVGGRGVPPEDLLRAAILQAKGKESSS